MIIYKFRLYIFVVICIILKIGIFFFIICKINVVFFMVKVRNKYSTIFLIKDFMGGFIMSGTVIVIFSLLSLSLVYFLLNVCIQFNRINNLNLLLGMDVTKLYNIDENHEDDYYFNYLIRKSAMQLYILTNKRT